MAAEAIRYVNDRPVIPHNLLVDEELLGCSQCDEVYRVHYSQSGIAVLDEIRFRASEIINEQHPHHKDAIFLG
jgi:hypothetical protein